MLILASEFPLDRVQEVAEVSHKILVGDTEVRPSQIID